jgi:hypothetical protein
MKSSRLDGFSFSKSSSPESDAQHMLSVGEYAPIATEKLMGYLAEVEKGL